jgi:hydrogenase nickel incorporation protein HypB
MDKAKSYALQVNPDLQILEVSCATGKGLSEWFAWIEQKMQVPQTS